MSLRGGRDDPLAYRKATASGEYDHAREIVLRARSLNGRAGNHVLTPLRLAGGRAILVDRGWVPIELDEPPVPGAAPPQGRVEVRGVLAPAEPKARFFGPSDPATGTLRTIGRVDLERIGAQLPYPMKPLYLALESQSPSQSGELPRPAGLPAPGEGPHLAYAVQWFLFGLIALVAGTVLLRRERRRGRGRDYEPAAPS